MRGHTIIEPWRHTLKIKNVLTTFIFLLAVISISFADNDVWAKADSKTAAILKQTNDLINKKAYFSAYKGLRDADNQNDFILAKELKICLDYFVTSIGHSMFALTDLKPDQTIESLRGQPGNFQMVLFDPAKMFPEYEASHGQSGILKYMLGEYYYEVLKRYPGNWLEEDDAVIRKAIDNYKLAFSMKYLDAYSLSNAGELCLRIGDMASATTYTTQAISMDSSNANSYYNLAYAYFAAGNNEMALSNCVKAIDMYKNNPQYLYDSYLMKSDILLNLAKYDEALSALDKASSINSNDYHLPLKRNNIYLKMGDFNKARDFALQLFAVAPTNPASPQLVIKNYQNYQFDSQLIDFFDTAIGKYQENQHALGNLYFHKSQIEFRINQKDKALADIKKAKNCFLNVLPSTDPVFNVIEEGITAYSK
jgi:tetratricopeptide (TPR) repeat protein